jgi:hypothetical protein
MTELEIAIKEEIEMTKIFYNRIQKCLQSKEL